MRKGKICPRGSIKSKRLNNLNILLENRMKSKLILLALLGILVMACGSSKKLIYGKESQTLQIQQLTKNTFVHTSYLDIPNYGKFACNGLIYFNKDEAIIFDTPTTDSVSAELMGWIQNTMNKKIKAVVVNHFHEDCLGGLSVFHDAGIKSYANQATIELARREGNALPQAGFQQKLELHLGSSKVISEYLGPAHTMDNIISYLPSEHVLFGGCMIKSMGATKGNIQDANVSEWPRTIRTIRERYGNLQFVVPGHGEVGGKELLSYTIDLFEN